MKKEQAVKLIAHNVGIIIERCNQMIDRGEIEAAVNASSEARHHACALAGWYLPNRNPNRRRRAA